MLKRKYIFLIIYSRKQIVIYLFIRVDVSVGVHTQQFKLDRLTNNMVCPFSTFAINFFFYFFLNITITRDNIRVTEN